MHEIFISYKREERAQAALLAEALQARGWTVWWDPLLRAGENFDDDIERHIRAARCVIVLWSRLSTAAPYVRDEAGLALDLGKLLPVAMDGTELPLRFRRIHTIQLQQWQGSALAPAYQELVRNLEAMAGRPAAASIAVPSQMEPVTPHQPAAAGVEDPGDDDAVLRLAEAGDLDAVRARLGIRPPEWEESLVVTEADTLLARNTHRSSKCLPPSEFDRLLRRLVQISLQSGDGARALYVAMAHGHRDIALQMLKLMRSAN